MEDLGEPLFQQNGFVQRVCIQDPDRPGVCLLALIDINGNSVHEQLIKRIKKKDAADIVRDIKIKSIGVYYDEAGIRIFPCTGCCC